MTFPGNRERKPVSQNHCLLSVSGLGMSCCAANMLVFALGCLLVKVLAHVSLESHREIILALSLSCLFGISSTMGGMTVLTLFGQSGLRIAILVTAFWFCLWSVTLDIFLPGNTNSLFWFLSAILYAVSVFVLFVGSRFFRGIHPWRK